MPSQPIYLRQIILVCRPFASSVLFDGQARALAALVGHRLASKEATLELQHQHYAIMIGSSPILMDIFGPFIGQICLERMAVGHTALKCMPEDWQRVCILFSALWAARSSNALIKVVRDDDADC